MANPIEAIKRALFRPFKKRFDRLFKELAEIRSSMAELTASVERLSQALAENQTAVRDIDEKLVQSQIAVERASAALDENRKRVEDVAAELDSLDIHITCIDDSLKSIEMITASQCTSEMQHAGVLNNADQV